ncbi:hypothetical protein IB267_02575 [Ensifer sp. ENS09]|uniref:hypothetical protein n=1 Tax=Ensifer sp. ENS09 TaxID=2769263 RepID=UPI0017858E8A|nr:hypothetical protein [Ensifer sp. ENS09]MBD9647231.1 hypothetical protein [Ensifer sp. ENS09]
MFEHWAVMWTVLQRERRDGARNGLDDPLDGPEWRGLHWVLPVFSFLLNRRRSDARLTRGPAIAGRKQPGTIIEHTVADLGGCAGALGCHYPIETAHRSFDIGSRTFGIVRSQDISLRAGRPAKQ